MDVMKRCLSGDAFNTLLRLTSWVGRWNHARQFPNAPDPWFWSSLLGEFVLFLGTIGSDTMSRGCVDCFIASPCCAYMDIVSKVDGASGPGYPASFSVCVFVKFGNVQDITLIYTNSLTSSSNFHKVNKRVANVEQFYQAIRTIMNGASVANSIRNVIITKDFRCLESCSSHLNAHPI
ncbi:uncharacterized protein LOC110713537 isoform X2 [Chenopodium quinoa]|uniref:uncharacterized protein LOC110713537 isoform X1 n=1 Tax=Chenopodium quinoa TaxID=63459 RepID=UPI000B77CDA8|nr:uncharacterized protein LOC110713537 isoform X1 [Chenopodium quinoa]XP_021747678.1 uncharacterized protein LOC110713537 isoform X2 [Chenopodium quinoa]